MEVYHEWSKFNIAELKSWHNKGDESQPSPTFNVDLRGTTPLIEPTNAKCVAAFTPLAPFTNMF